MSNTLIMMDPPLARQKAGEIRALKKEYEDTVNQIEKVMSSLDEFWKGAAQREYINQFTESRQQLLNMGEAIENYAKLLDEVAGDFESVDNDLAKQIANQG